MKLRYNDISKWVLFLYIVVFKFSNEVIVNRIAFIAMAFVCSLSLIMEKSNLYRKNIFVSGLFVYGVVLLASYTYTICPSSKAQTMLISYFMMFVFIFFLNNRINAKNDVLFFLRAYIIASVLSFIKFVLMYGISGIMSMGDAGLRLGDELSNSNTVGMSFALAAVISIFFIFESIQIWKKVIYGGVVALSFVCALISGSRKALIILFLGAFIVILFRSPEKKVMFKKLRVFLLATAVLVVMYLLLRRIDAFSVISRRIDQFIYGFLGTNQYDHSALRRIEMIEIGMNAFKESPLLGKGIYASYSYFNMYSHNNFVELLMNTGIIGFSIFYYPFIKAICTIHKNKENRLFGLMLFLVLWTIIGGYAIVEYYDKSYMGLMVILGSWMMICKERKEYVND